MIEDMNEIPDEPKFVFSIHYHSETGIIRNWGYDDGSTESFAPDHLIKRYYETVDVDPFLQKIDVQTGELIKKTIDEQETAALPLLKTVIMQELATTDQYMVSDRPLTDAERDQWRTYRQALRDLKGDAKTILKEWPDRPDGASGAATFVQAKIQVENPDA